MKISRLRIKEIVRETIVEENEYQAFFQKCLAKAGKSIPNMGEQEKKDFFNKIDSAWQSRGEKRGNVKEKVFAPKSSPVFEAKPIEISTAKHIASVGDNGNDYMTVYKKAKDNKIRKYLATIGEKGFRNLLSRSDLEKYIFEKKINEKADTSQKGVFIQQVADGTWKISANTGSDDFAHTFKDVFKDEKRARKFGDKIAKNYNRKLTTLKSLVNWHGRKNEVVKESFDNAFYKYMLSFYGKDGLYPDLQGRQPKPSQIANAIKGVIK